ncbi:cob(I)yrinic acid a,c-diamide adenosyltransferase [Candidatus Woesearchaeota archaeon]|jgi:cob(I)alamin adenosyltransferase|nr:cob(I)yrinic acid a,c-diamide adenosyltransferase [Candidatus Woesearchaeota archaeon]MBT4114434.1 cob(I)yrinic acid a,c-diamide adenosyltransferase [Candidatus Woesearchaeota archaeon]MBT4248246.1 cob(I)yrinic acid a,c-diamide adenosyltransferase [Candidatus Woesearchaeota archaeon]
MVISTGKGDTGETTNSIGDKKDKCCTSITSIGVIDELNSQLGVILTLEVNKKTRDILDKIQHELFKLGADLSTPPFTKQNRISVEDIDFLKNLITALEEKLPKLTKFVLPGGAPSAAELHVARTICRRAETQLVQHSQEKEVNPRILTYINKLSDLLFLLALWENKQLNIKEKLVGLDEDLTPFLD